jgi:hypothetical protein
MSHVLGAELPPALVARLGGEELETKVGPTIFLTTVDDGGFPHLALLSYGEVLALSPQELRVIIWETGSTAHYLGARGTACVALVEPGQVISIKARARPLGAALPGNPPLAGFALDVVQVLADEEAGAEMTAAATHRYTDRTPEALVAGWRRQLAALRGL